MESSGAFVNGSINSNCIARKGSEEQVDPTNQLIQLAQAASGSIIQIPADVVTSLLHQLAGLQDSVIGLQNSIAKLGNDNQTLRQELSIVEKHVLRLQIDSGVEFALFPKLPLEIQRMIWGHCPNIPQIVALERFARSPFSHLTPTTTSRHCLLRVCKEARSEALKKMLSLQPHRSSYSTIFNFDPSSLPPIFFNKNVDTVWIDHDNRYPEGQLIPYLKLYRCYGSKHTPIRKLAIGYQSWYNQMENQMDDGDLEIMHHLAEMGTEEVILVVGDSVNNAARLPKIVFIRPHDVPTEAINKRAEFPTGISRERTWDMMDATAMQYLKDFQAQRDAEGRQYLLDAGGNEDDVNYDIVALSDCSYWTVKSVRYMEAMTMTELRKEQK
ncbi:hypothetical protein N431DRAFT_521243 [Stipitochalara longipes BDJ]|nr:hypothetical protein N431DRAFT_521243 [Stipitochalara longipes BDJ]